MSDPPIPRKTRTRQHVIADLGVNSVQRVVLLAGHTADFVRFDYGVDLRVQTFDPNGEVENGTIGFQVKATDRVAPHADGLTIPLRVSTRDVKFWLLEFDPIILALYDAAAERAYWLDVQEYARATDLDPDAGGTITLRIPVANVFDHRAVGLIRDRKNAIVRGGAEPGVRPEQEG